MTLRWKKLLLLVSGLFITLVALEIFLRLTPENDFQTNNSYQYTKKIGEPVFQEPFYSMQELYPLQFDQRRYYKKSEGIIRYDFNQIGSRWVRAEEQSTNGYNVFVLGDSFTLGFGLRYEDTYIYRTQDRLNQKGIPINFWNFSRPAANSKQCLSIYQKCAKRIDHQVILYGLHLNDLIEFQTNYVVNLETSRITRALARRSRLFYFLLKTKNTYLDRKRRIMELTSRAVFDKPYFHENIQAIVSLKEEAEKDRKEFRVVVLPILVDLNQDTFRPLYQGIVKNLKDRGIRFFDLTSSVRASRDSDYWILPFDQHPNEKANEIFANQLTEMFLQDPAISKSLAISPQRHSAGFARKPILDSPIIDFRLKSFD